jgi:metallo-beta-lactamase class B
MHRFRFLWVLALFGALSCARPGSTPSAFPLVFARPELRILQVSPHAFVHVTYLQTDEFGKVPCNGLVLHSGGEAVIFDTPPTDADAQRLIQWVTDSLHLRIRAIVPTHFHNDCLGGLQAFHAKGIPSYASALTRELARANQSAVPETTFQDSLNLRFGADSVWVRFHGEGHTRDNVVAWFETEKVLFGGCLVKELGAGKGYLGDANIQAWPRTVDKVKRRYPQVNVVIPGHGEPGPADLLDYTIRMFSETRPSK